MPLDTGSLTRRQRLARAAAGSLFLSLAAALAWGGFALEAALVATWFGLSHLVAGATGYRGCPELGAIASLLRRRPVVTRCAPWDRIDKRLD